MKLEQLYEKYGINEDELNTIVVSMMEGKGLKETSFALNEKLTEEQIFAIGKFYCEMEFLTPIDEMAPRYALDRMDIQEKNIDSIMAKIEITKEMRKIKEIEEDLKLLQLENSRKYA